jgi:Flp pilus assembly protein TadG
MKTRNLLHLLRSEHGASLVETAVLLPLFSLLLFVAVDLGRACYLVDEIAGAARAAAIYGSRNPTDTTGMSNAAKDDAPDVPSLSVTTPTYGCECSDGTGYSASCATIPTCTSTTEVYRVNITVTGTYAPMLPWPGIPSSMSFSSTASMRSAGS